MYNIDLFDYDTNEADAFCIVKVIIYFTYLSHLL